MITGGRRKKVQVWIYASSRGAESAEAMMFLLLRTRPERGGFWQPVTGGVEPDEALPDAALREAIEETGIQFGTATPVDLQNPFEFESRGWVFEEHGFALRAPEVTEDIRLDPHEHDAFCWASAKEAFELLRFPSNGDMLRVVLGRIAGHIEE